MNRIPIRIRLTLPFAVTMAAVLAAMGVFIYLRVGSQLLTSVDTNLRAQLAEVKANAREQHQLIDQDATEGPTIAAVELPSGARLASAPQHLAALPLRTRGQSVVFLTAPVQGLHGPWRLAEQRANLAGRDVVLIAGRSLAARDETLDRLAREFLLSAPAALLLAVLAGYGLAAAALRPVEAMRRRAAAVSAGEPGRRLPVPRARDEIRALAETLNEMLERLEAALEHERRFVGDASHELRTPLALLRAELELAVRRPRSRAALEAALHSAVDETERLSRLADDLLLIARADQGRLPIRLERVSTRRLLETVRDRFVLRGEVLGRSIRTAEVHDDMIDADPLRIEQALGNLVDNALEHGTGDVTLSECRVNGTVELHVTDEGPGFDDAFVRRAFDRFSRAADAREGTGTGLGLSIVALIAQAHGGEADVRNRAEGGADVWISLKRS